jgi:2-dehydro-3-deoxyphosphogluconate aldolase / (4S)-4-hydroxy-2-oxoglutarate aldolase
MGTSLRTYASAVALFRHFLTGYQFYGEARILLSDKSTRSQRQAIDGITIEGDGSVAAILTSEEVVARIEKIGIIPALRLDSAVEDVLFVAEALAEAGVPIVEISMADRAALACVSLLVRHAPGIIVGAGNLFNADEASRYLNAGAKFLTSDIFVPEIVQLAAKQKVAVIPGALTPAEIMLAWKAGADFVNVTPCDAMGGHNYMKSLKAALPKVRLVAAGGVNQLTALSFVKAGATALSVGEELTPNEAIWMRQTRRIQELARRFRSSVDAGRIWAAERMDSLQARA